MDKKVSDNSRNYLNFLHNKKATLTTTEKIIYFIPVAIIIGVIAVVFGFVATNYYQSVIFVPDGLEDELTLNRFFSSPSCFVYEDPYTGRSYPGILDKEKLTQQQLIKCYNNPQKKNVQISAQKDNNEIIKDSSGKEIKLFSENFRNRGPRQLSRQILLRDGDITYSAKLIVVIESE